MKRRKYGIKDNLDYDEDNFGGTNIGLEKNKIIGDIGSFAGANCYFLKFSFLKIRTMARHFPLNGIIGFFVGIIG